MVSPLVTARSILAKWDRHPGDRVAMFQAVADEFPAERVLYAGSFIDVAASAAFDDVTYVDNNFEARRFFTDHEGVAEIIREQRKRPGEATFRFVADDYTHDLDRDAGLGESFDMLVSMFAGFVTAACSRYLKPGGLILVNDSNGDASLAWFDPGNTLVGSVVGGNGAYIAARHGPEDHFVLRKPAERFTRDIVWWMGAGRQYTQMPFAYVFQRTS